MTRRPRDDTKILSVLTEWLPGFGFSSSGCVVVRISSCDSAPTTISTFDREETKRLADHWIVTQYNETACCPPGRYCEHAISNIADLIGRSPYTIKNTIRQHRLDGPIALSS
jgi:hypothetical protein